jgi:hypothetical protein
MKPIFVIAFPFCGLGVVDAPSNYLEIKLFPVVSRSIWRPLSRRARATGRPSGGRIGHEFGNTTYLLSPFVALQQSKGTATIFDRKFLLAPRPEHAYREAELRSRKNKLMDVGPAQKQQEFAALKLRG